MTLENSMLSHIQAGLQAQADIDRQIAELQEAVCKLQAQINTLRTQRNTFSPVSRLPSELLSAIFVYCAQAHHEEMKQMDWIDCESSTNSDSTTTEEMDIPGWVNVSYVCRHWRGVALNSPTFWAYVLPTSQRWTELMLSRSNQAPLMMCFNSRKLHLLDQVLVYIKRIQELDLRISPFDYEMVFERLSSPAPFMRSLVVEVGNAVDNTDQPVLLDRRSVFKGTAPALRRLELSRCPIPRPTSMLKDLTTLILRHSIQLSIADLATALRSMQNLVHLELHHALSFFRDNKNALITAGSDELRLPHLLRLAIAEAPFLLIDLLSCLDISLKTRVWIQTTSPPYENEWMPLCSDLAKQLFMPRENLPPSIRTLAIEVYIGWKTTFTFNGSENMPWRSEPLDWDCDSPIRLVVTNDHERHTIPYIVQDAYCRGLLAGLQSASVTFRLEKDWGYGTLLEIALGFVPELQSIQLIGAERSLGSLCLFLSCIPYEDRERPPPSTSFGEPLPFSYSPTLEELALQRARFDHMDDLPDPYDCVHPGSASDLYGALVIRKEKGYTLNRLILGECRNLFKEDVDKLKSLVAEVIWDGVEVEDRRPKRALLAIRPAEPGSDSDMTSRMETIFVT